MSVIIESNKIIIDKKHYRFSEGVFCNLRYIDGQLFGDVCAIRLIDIIPFNLRRDIEVGYGNGLSLYEWDAVTPNENNSIIPTFGDITENEITDRLLYINSRIVLRKINKSY